jgi:serine/threonine protein phosphatase PrpC
MNVGDSRTYLFRGGTLARLTRDDSLVQALLDTGAITASQARVHPQRSVVLEALDGTPRAFELTAVPAALGDRLLLCSDGLTDVVPEPAIASVLESHERPEAADRLVSLALNAGARDNVSVVIADVVRSEGPGSGWLQAL